MAEHPSLTDDILERVPGLQQAGIDHSARLIGLAITSYLSWHGFNPARLTRDELAQWLQDQYALLGRDFLFDTVLSLAAKLSELFTPRLEDLVSEDEIEDQDA